MISPTGRYTASTFEDPRSTHAHTRGLAKNQSEGKLKNFNTFTDLKMYVISEINNPPLFI